jgi:hypothetical protein
VQDGDMQTRAIWLELDNKAVLIMGNVLQSLTKTPASMKVDTPAGMANMNGAAAVVHFTRSNGQWIPAHISGVRLRSVNVGGEKVFAADQLQEKVDQEL